MSDQVEHEEVQAILDAIDDGGAGQVQADIQPRNFRQPRRLSRQRLQYLAQLVNAGLQGVCREVATPLRQHHKISLASVSEVNVQGLFRGYEPPFVVNTIEVGGHVSWVLWDSSAAAASVETILSGPKLIDGSDQAGGGDDEEEAPKKALDPGSNLYQPRRLSHSECRVVEALLHKIVGPVAAALGLDVTEGRLAQEPEELTTIEDCGPGADARRLMLHFLFEGPGAPSDIRIYLPDVGEEDPALNEEADDQTPLPEHLNPVNLTLSAYLASIDLSLNELMALEVGDVIPLGVEVGTPIELYIEDRCCAEGDWGRHGTQQALRIETLTPRLGTIDHPEE